MGKRTYANKRVLNPLSGNTQFSIPLTQVDNFEDFLQTFFVIAFYDANDNLVTPTGGTVVVTAEPIAGQTLGPSAGDSTIPMTAVKAGALSTYTPPVFSGPVVKVNASITSPAGAAQYSACVWQTRT